MFPMPSFLGNREQEISGFLNILLPRGDGEGLESKIMKMVLRTWDLLCREFGLVWFALEMRPRALSIQSMHSTPEPYPFPKGFLGFSLSRDETL